MKPEQFCELYAAYHGEPLDNIEQLVEHNFTGQELFEFVDFCVKHGSAIKKWAEENIVVEDDSENLKYIIFKPNKSASEPPCVWRTETFM